MFREDGKNNRLKYCGLRIFDCGLRTNPKSEIRNPKSEILDDHISDIASLTLH